jgi:hypothetical protein
VFAEKAVKLVRLNQIRKKGLDALVNCLLQFGVCFTLGHYPKRRALCNPKPGILVLRAEPEQVALNCHSLVCHTLLRDSPGAILHVPT